MSKMSLATVFKNDFLGVENIQNKIDLNYKKDKKTIDFKC